MSSFSALEAVAKGVPSQGIDFGYCGVSTSTSRTFTLTNPSSTNIRFNINSDQSYFEASPVQGKLVAHSIVFTL